MGNYLEHLGVSSRGQSDMFSSAIHERVNEPYTSRGVLGTAIFNSLGDLEDSIGEHRDSFSSSTHE